MSAEIPWTVGPGETLPKAPAVGLCGEAVVTVDGGYTHTGPCRQAKYHDGPHTSEAKEAPPLASVEPESASSVEARYQAQYEAERVAFAEAYSRAMRVKLEAERDQALLGLQQARAAVAYWQAKAEGRS